MASVLQSLFRSPKTIVSKPEWSRPTPPDKSIALTVPLAINGAVQQGLYLLGRALEHEPAGNISFTLAFQPGDTQRKRVLLARIDWRPMGWHANRRGPSELIGVRIVGSHHHEFDVNWSPHEDRPLKGLPVALPMIPDPDKFASLRDAVGKAFSIVNPIDIPEPEWSMELF